jgi:hypothetical protein
MSDAAIERLVARGVLRRVEPDRQAAERELASANQHLATAAKISSDDEVAGVAVAYEAARKAIRAHMRANGLRASGGEGAHARIGEYGVAALDTPDLARHFRAFDDVRKLRNRSQYEAIPVEAADVAFALEHARAVVAAVEADLS